MADALNARELVVTVLDAGSFQSWDLPATESAGPAYRLQLRRAAERAGTDEAVLTGRGTVGGRPVAVLVSEFAFLAGSVGRAAARRITGAVRRATAERLPILASTASGGTRMQEGTPAFVDMITITRAVTEHRAAGLPYLVHLRHPTTGGVLASWGSLGHLTVAEPGALIGFLGPRVYQALCGEPIPGGVQTAENLAARGVIDGVVETTSLARTLDRTLGILLDPPQPPGLPRRVEATRRVDPWDAVLRTRRDDRVGVRDLLRYGSSGTVRLSRRDASILVALTRLDGQPCLLVGQDRSASEPLGPGALRQARRGMDLAQSLGLPLVTVIDTAGAELSPAAEEAGLAGEIAQCLATMTALTVPTVSVLLGQGAGGGAIALLPATRVVALEHAWLAPITPEGSSAIVHGTVTRAAEMAAGQQITAPELHALGLVHRVIPEYDTDTTKTVAEVVAAECGAALSAGALYSGTPECADR